MQGPAITTHAKRPVTGGMALWLAAGSHEPARLPQRHSRIEGDDDTTSPGKAPAR